MLMKTSTTMVLSSILIPNLIKYFHYKSTPDPRNKPTTEFCHENITDYSDTETIIDKFSDSDDRDDIIEELLAHDALKDYMNEDHG